MTFELLVPGYADVLREALNGLVVFLQDGGFRFFLSIGIAFFVISLLVRAALESYVDWKKIIVDLFLLTAIVVGLTGVNDNKVMIVDTITGNTYYVDNVPYIAAFPLWAINVSEREISSLFDKAYSMPNGVGASSIGYLGGPSLLYRQAMYVDVANSYLRRSLVRFYKDCVFPAIVEGRISPDRVRRDYVENVINAVGSLEAPLPTVYYDTTNPDGTVLTCEDAASKLVGDLGTDRLQSISLLAERLGFPGSSQFLALAGNEYSYFFGIASNAERAIYNQALIGIGKDALISMAGEAGISPAELGLTVSTAKRKLLLANISMGQQMTEFLPKVKAYMEVLIVTLMPVLLVIGLISGKPARYITMILFIFMVPLLWEALLTVTNMVVAVKLQGLRTLVESFSLPGNPAINMDNFPLIYSEIQDWLAIGGWMAGSTALFSIALLTGSAYAATKFVSGMSSAISGSTSGAAGSIASGNLSYGNTSIGNTSVNNFSANKHDLAFVYADGNQISNVSGMTNKNKVDTQDNHSTGATFNRDGKSLTPALTSQYINKTSGGKTDTSNTEHKGMVSTSEGKSQHVSLGKDFKILESYADNFGKTNTVKEGIASKVNLGVEQTFGTGEHTSFALNYGKNNSSATIFNAGGSLNAGIKAGVANAGSGGGSGAGTSLGAGIGVTGNAGFMYRENKNEYDGSKYSLVSQARIENIGKEGKVFEDVNSLINGYTHSSNAGVNSSAGESGSTVTQYDRKEIASTSISGSNVNQFRGGNEKAVTQDVNYADSLALRVSEKLKNMNPGELKFLRGIAKSWVKKYGFRGVDLSNNDTLAAVLANAAVRDPNAAWLRKRLGIDTQDKIETGVMEYTQNAQKPNPVISEAEGKQKKLKDERSDLKEKVLSEWEKTHSSVYVKRNQYNDELNNQADKVNKNEQEIKKDNSSLKKEVREKAQNQATNAMQKVDLKAIEALTKLAKSLKPPKRVTLITNDTRAHEKAIPMPEEEVEAIREKVLESKPALETTNMMEAFSKLKDGQAADVEGVRILREGSKYYVVNTNWKNEGLIIYDTSSKVNYNQNNQKSQGLEPVDMPFNGGHD
ncbi:conjugal transfer protein TraG N-terminal domain-containing protein [Desulfurobacterium sp.]